MRPSDLDGNIKSGQLFDPTKFRIRVKKDVLSKATSTTGLQILKTKRPSPLTNGLNELKSQSYVAKEDFSKACSTTGLLYSEHQPPQKDSLQNESLRDASLQSDSLEKCVLQNEISQDDSLPKPPPKEASREEVPQEVEVWVKRSSDKATQILPQDRIYIDFEDADISNIRTMSTQTSGQSLILDDNISEKILTPTGSVQKSISFEKFLSKGIQTDCVCNTDSFIGKMNALEAAKATAKKSNNINKQCQTDICMCNYDSSSDDNEA